MLSDWESESDLTELESEAEDDDEYVPSKKRKSSRQAKSTKEYTISNALRPPRATNYSTKYIYDLMVDGNIDLDPQYQRDVVWPETKQVGLIDSLMRNYYVPPIIFAVKPHPETGEDVRVCIDGKQRLTSLRRFLDSEIAHRDAVTGKKYFFKQPSKGMKRATLPQALVRSFQMKQIVCMEYTQIDDEQEREIFQRVQLGMALTVAERMQAISGPWPDLIREIQAAVVGDEGFGNALDWETGRGRDFQNLAMIVFLITEPKVIHPHATQLEKWLERTTPVTPKMHNDILQTFRIFVHLVKDPKYCRAFQKPARFSPIEFIMTGYAIYTLGIRGRLTYGQLSTVIANMRATARKKHDDVRANKRVLTTMDNYLRTVIKKPPPLDPDDDDTPASEAINGGTKKAAKAPKRKRSDVHEEEEELPPKRAGPSKTTTAKAASTTKAKAKAAPKASAPKATGSKTTVKKVTTVSSASKASAAPSKAPKPAAQPSASTSASASPAAHAPNASSSTPSSSRTATPQHASTAATSETMGPPAVPRRSTQDDMDVDPAAPADRQSPSTSRGTPDARRNSTSTSTALATQPPPTATQPPPARTTASPPVAIKPDPDAHAPGPARRPSVLDRLAPIRAARGVPAPLLVSPGTSLFAQHQREFLGSPTAVSPMSPTATHALAPFLQRPPDAAAHANGVQAHPQTIAAAVQSMLARGAGAPASPTAPFVPGQQRRASASFAASSPVNGAPVGSAGTGFAGTGSAGLGSAGSAPPGSGTGANNPAADAAQDKSHSAPPASTANGNAQPNAPAGARSLSPTLTRGAARMSPENAR